MAERADSTGWQARWQAGLPRADGLFFVAMRASS